MINNGTANQRIVNQVLQSRFNRNAFPLSKGNKSKNAIECKWLLVCIFLRVNL